MTQEEYWYWFCNIKDIWQGKMDILIEAFKEPEKVFKAKEEELSKIKGINSKDLNNIIDSKKDLNKLKELNNLDKRGISFIYYGHKDYPQKFINIHKKPYSLYVKGKLPAEDRPSVAIIGSRDCTNYGKEMAGKISCELAGYGVEIITGFARGIDSYGQWGAIKGKGTCYGVLGCGIDICYPKENFQLYQETILNGGIISEYPLGSEPISWHFPLRNRLISALSDKIIVVEAKEKSGTCITVDHALEQGKDVFAVPGRLTDSLSSGCNRLIKEGASIYTGVSDLFQNLPKNHDNYGKIEAKKIELLEKDFDVVYSKLDFLPKNIQQIIEETNLDGREVIRILVEMEIMELIDEPIKNSYSRKS